ncbi:MAG: histidinol dehydrogenase, partial [Gammaproteobacteria bacterium]|nr:histidinol dehydrogenase [Gammaproteobacteria bacterium]
MRLLDGKTLTPAERRSALRRPAMRDARDVEDAARRIVDDVRRRGDAALIDLTRRLDGVGLESFAVSAA